MAFFYVFGVVTAAAKQEKRRDSKKRKTRKSKYLRNNIPFEEGWDAKIY
jgi:hypothetical protein